MLQNLPLVGILIIGLNILFTFIGFKNDNFFDQYRFQIGKIREGEYFRLLSSGFLHVNTTHLLFNMFTFYFFVNIVVGMLGTVSFLGLFLGSLLAGNFFAYYFHFKDSYYSAVGASGAVTGVLFSALLLYPNIELMLFLIPIPIPGYLFGIGYILYTLYGMKAQNDTIGHTAHFGGAIGGILITLLVKPEVLYSSILMLSILSLAVITAGVLLYRQQR
ncbi:MAG: rhomboid family intramembrane serine protease [Flavobacteriaceae bacterium]|jgi:membrane associated rhomboid family serine protease|nr:rhomboid family intramembrane serine protease [Flavobacteriaceae bacterium]MDG2387575.1 rhomboid family intramembrane serine protease [Flavobacteriaceae bacterium]